MRYRNLILGCFLGLSVYGTSYAQDFQQFPSGLEYHFSKKGEGTRTGNVGDLATMHLVFQIGDSILIDSRQMNNFMPFDQPINEPVFKGDVFEGIARMKKGDIAIFRLKAQDFFSRNNQPTPEWVKANDYAQWTIEMVDIKNQEEVEAENAKRTAKQMSMDDNLIKDYLEKEGIKIATRPADGKIAANPKMAYKDDSSGLYYIVLQTGTGLEGKNGNRVSVNYTGSLLDGTVFDSNTDPQFNHVQPIEFTVGAGQMIKGWDKMLPLMRTGDKVIAIMPSPLCYGPQARPPHIGANAILKFEMELLDAGDKAVAQQQSDNKAIEAHLKAQKIKLQAVPKNGIKKANGKIAYKDPSGIYYVVHKLGSGAAAEKGKKATVNYTGSLLDGTVFDSNVDPKFNHVSPFTFNVGAGNVIKGWDAMLPLMKKGQKVTVYIPSGMAYGPQARPPHIPANGILRFDIELKEVE